jgi:hypothetical protein
MDLDLRRRFYAEELEAVCRLRSRALVDALAAVPRERFLPPGPWTVLVDVASGSGSGIQTRVTTDADPARRPAQCCETLSVLPSGSLNHAIRAPFGDCQIPCLS